MALSIANGKICYIELPASNVEQSAKFYLNVFDWQSRKRGDGATAFDDTTGQVSGAWVTGRPASSTVGLLVYVMVFDLNAACRLVEANGGVIVERCAPDAREQIARFRDPAGNVLGLYQETT